MGRKVEMTRERQFELAAFVFVGGVVAFMPAAMAQAEDYPNRRIELIVPVAAGGGLDLHARILADQLSTQLGQTVNVINQPGAAGTLGASAVARAEPDGYTLLLQSVSTAIAVVHTMDDLPYDPMTDLQPVSLMASFPLVLTANKDVPANNLAEFIELVKANPETYTYGHSGTGTQLEIVGEFFADEAGIDLLGVPYNGTGPILTDLLSGRISTSFNGLPAEIERIEAGDVKALAVTSSERSPAAPDIPTMKETFPDFDMPFWIGIYAPAGTPDAIVEKLSDEINEAVHTPAVETRLIDIGSEPIGSTPQELETYMQEQLALYGDIVARMNAPQ